MSVAAASRAGDERPVLLVLRALGLGDLLTAVPALRALADAFPDHRRVLAAPAWLDSLVPLIADADGRPALDELLDTVPFFVPPAGLGGEPAVAVNLHGRGPESHRLLLSLRPGRLLAFAHPHVVGSFGAPRWRAREHEVLRWCRLLEESGIACDAGALEIDRPPLASTALPARVRGATLIHPGAASAARRWPVERWAAVAAAERTAGRTVVVSGGPGERALAEAVSDGAGLPREAVLAGRTTPRELAALVGAAGRVLCADTGVGHLATALRTPSVLLFGPVSPAEWGPPPDRAAHRVLWKGRRGDPHSRRTDEGLLRIGVAEVLEALAELTASVR